ncbi:hypothetical protein [Bifidobacterium mongoliense]|uniref:hypothetical protein n=1 Tax=Bifidobacterium mongoliense TaxID=518643 RepID=UPI002649DB32|nr:hypothetical protein [Bifidobacterium mongoliense]MDN6024715.1 hypothetical protein [Bifidobacterium mongoliense]MDN6719140.1 hypothetical protein [Bifidobacterium mongoliense]
MSDHTQTIPDDLDFDHADERNLDGEILKAGESSRSRYIVRYPSMFARTYTGHTYRLPLDLTDKDFDDANDSMTPVEQIRALLVKANPGQSDTLKGEPSVVMLGIADKYADVIEKVQLASLGKYSPSDGKSTRPAAK